MIRRYRGYDSVGSKGWVYGDLVHNIKITCEKDIPRVMVGGYEVYEDTIGQSTGLYDKDGREVFEGDIIRVRYNDRDLFDAPIVWVDRLAGFFMKEDERCFSHIPDSSFIEVIGKDIVR